MVILCRQFVKVKMQNKKMLSLDKVRGPKSSLAQHPQKRLIWPCLTQFNMAGGVHASQPLLAGRSFPHSHLKVVSQEENISASGYNH